MNLSSIDNPREYEILFYTTDSFKTNEVSDFTDWIGIPPSAMNMETSPKDIVVSQGEQQLIPANIFSTFSNNVTDIGFSKGRNDGGSDFNSSGLHVTVERIPPELFKINVSPQTPIGFYTIPFTASIFIETTIESVDPTSNYNESGFKIQF